MCGILGILSDNKENVNEKLFHVMLETIKHRGPDDTGTDIFGDQHIALGHVRLSVIDLSPSGHQPMWNSRKDICIVYNGEIYNFESIRFELERKGKKFNSKSDTEVILVGYEEWGIEIVNRLNGMFAFAIWDKRDKKLWIARDRLGKKPLYYFFDKGSNTFIFASDIKAILKNPIVPRSVNISALHSYFALGYVISPITMFNSIYKLPAGFTLEFETGKEPVLQRYWDITTIQRIRESKQDYMTSIRELLEDSVKIRLVSDVPIGAFLSGGVDSSLIAGLMSRLLDQPVRTFSAAFDIGPRSFKYNVDADAAEKTSRFFGTDHTRLTINIKDNIMEQLQNCVYHMDEPHGNPTDVSTYLLAQKVKDEGITVVLSGDGSDEIFGGYTRYQFDKKLDLIRLIPEPCRNILNHIANLNPKFSKVTSALSKAKWKSNTPERYLMWWEEFDKNMRSSVFSEHSEQDSEFVYYEIEKVLGKMDVKGNQDAMSFMDLIFWISEESNMRMDKMTMAHALESRAPFLDYRLVEYGMSIPFNDKVSLGKPKELLKETFKSFLPQDVLNRPKWGFFSPVHYWINEKLGIEAENSIKALMKTGLFSKQVLEYSNHNYMIKKPNHVWMLMVFAIWYNTYIENIL